MVLHPDGRRVLLMHHHRHQRWLLPGGHVEEADVTLSDAARREAIEETAVRIAGSIGAPCIGWPVWTFTAFPRANASRSICITI